MGNETSDYAPSCFLFFKRTVRGSNCKKDFNGGQGQLCGFEDVYLKQTVFDENLYDIAEAFDKKKLIISLAGHLLVNIFLSKGLGAPPRNLFILLGIPHPDNFTYQKVGGHVKCRFWR